MRAPQIEKGKWNETKPWISTPSFWCYDINRVLRFSGSGSDLRHEAGMPWIPDWFVLIMPRTSGRTFLFGTSPRGRLRDGGLIGWGGRMLLLLLFRNKMLKQWSIEAAFHVNADSRSCRGTNTTVAYVVEPDPAIGPHVVGKLSSIFLKTRIPDPPSEFSQHDYKHLNLRSLEIQVTCSLCDIVNLDMVVRISLHMYLSALDEASPRGTRSINRNYKISTTIVPITHPKAVFCTLLYM